MPISLTFREWKATMNTNHLLTQSIQLQQLDHQLAWIKLNKMLKKIERIIKNIEIYVA